MSPTNRIHATFSRLRQARRTALIPFVMAGDPDLETTRRLILALADVGADLIEIGIPFSDPLADGPIIQRASTRSLARGTTPGAVLEMLRRASQQTHVPLVVLSYINPMLQYRDGQSAGMSAQAFLQDAARAGVCGVIVPDLPVEESTTFRDQAARVGLATVLLASPTSPADRLRRIARASGGFIYYVSVIGTTGVRQQLAPEWLQRVRQLKLITTKPICVGFGISTPAQAAAVARVADGVIIGSALLRALEPSLTNRRRLLARARRFLTPFRKAI